MRRLQAQSTRTPLPALARFHRAFWRMEDGNASMLSVLTILLMLAITGAAVDIMYQESRRVELQSVLDRAVLAAADLDQAQSPEGVVNDYVAKMGLAEHLTSVTTNGGASERVVTATAGMSVPTTFLHLTGVETLDLAALAVAEERLSNVEVSMVLDISGSMRFNGRMDQMKTASSLFVSKVLGENNGGVTTLNVIPFAGQVNPGSIMFDYFGAQRPTVPVSSGGSEGEGEGGTADHFPAWEQAISNIVLYFDTDGDDIYDRAHKIEDFPETAPRDVDAFYAGAVAFFVAEDPDLTSDDQFLGISIKGGVQTTQYFTVRGNSNGVVSDLGPTKNNGKIPGETFMYNQIDYDAWAPHYTEAPTESDEMTVNMPSSCIEIDDVDFGNTGLPTSDAYVPHFQFWPIAEEVMDWGWCPEDDTAIQYYSDSAAYLIDFIQNIRMHDGTGLQYGMKYALTLLDPNTRDAVNHLVDEGQISADYRDRPHDWNDPETQKYIVVMTDGEVTDQYRPLDPGAAINGEVDLQTQGEDSRYNAASRSRNLANLHDHCQLAQAVGVTIFAIAFETSTSAAEELRPCASSESHFFHVEGDQLTETFDLIARQINNLRLIQ